MQDNLDTGFVSAYKENGKVVYFEDSFSAESHRYFLLLSKEGRRNRYDVQYAPHPRKEK